MLFSENSSWLAWIWGGAITFALFVVATAASMVFTGFILVKMPANYFCDDYVRDIWVDHHPIIRWTGFILKNLLGVTLIVLGFVLSVPGIPGPGLLMVLFGITLLEFPGKRRLERWLIGRPFFFNAINRLRQHYGKPPIVLGSSK